MSNIRFGVNYVPSKNWWYSWTDWDAESIHEDLQAIQSLGMDHIRIHCLWPVFQPNASWVSPTALNRLEELLEMAVSCKLDVAVTVLDGWLCGFAFKPSWQKEANMFMDRRMIESEKLLFTELAKRIGGHPGFLGFDLGNELGAMTPFGNDISTEQGDAWQLEILNHCEEVAPGKFHVNGVDHVPWFMERKFSREALANTGAATSMHAWYEFAGARARYAPMDTGSVHLAEYCIEISKAYSRNVNRPIWLQEFGASSQWMDAEQIPDFAEHSIEEAGTCSNLWGFTWWCSHDLDSRLAGFDALEYDLGLLTIKNKVKPAGKRIATLIRNWCKSPPEVLRRSTALVMPDSLFSEEGASFQHPDYPGWRLAGPYMNLVQQGIRPSVILESMAGNKDYLKERGIKELVKLNDV